MNSTNSVRIAVAGCGHGNLDVYYRAIEAMEQQTKQKVDLLIVCGDFESIRNMEDLHCINCPDKYLEMGDFFKYYNGEKEAYVPTIFVGGNHEASNYLQEVFAGGYVAKDIYYMGFSGVINFGGLRIGGISGIYKSFDKNKSHYEQVPFTRDSKCSIIHTRSYEIQRLRMLQKPLDIFISHDWPNGITKYGNEKALLNKKKHFKEDICNNALGSPELTTLLNELQPRYWFAAHLHVKFAAKVHHSSGKDTRFLALDKCLPNRDYIQIMDIPVEHKQPLQLSYDVEWLSIFKSTYLSMTSPFDSSSSSSSLLYPSLGIKQEIMKTLEQEGYQQEGVYIIPNDFIPVAPCYYGDGNDKLHNCYVKRRGNPQTDRILRLLNLPHLLTIPYVQRPKRGLLKGSDSEGEDGNMSVGGITQYGNIYTNNEEKKMNINKRYVNPIYSEDLERELLPSYVKIPIHTVIDVNRQNTTDSSEIPTVMQTPIVNEECIDIDSDSDHENHSIPAVNEEAIDLDDVDDNPSTIKNTIDKDNKDSNENSVDDEVNNELKEEEERIRMEEEEEETRKKEEENKNKQLVIDPDMIDLDDI
ncbi:hypothetical protein WA158_001141 [Blastocystis sp. Blastoise]